MDISHTMISTTVDKNETLTTGNSSVEQFLWTNDNLSHIPVTRLHPEYYWSDSVERHITNWMQTYVPPLLILFGTIGNILSFWALRRSPKQCSVFFYMALYALTNTLNLYVACGLSWISHITGTPYIANLADWLCKVWQFFFSVMRYTSTWLVLAMVFDRFVYLAIPSWAHSFCTKFTAKILSCLIITVLVVIGIHAMWTYELTESHGCIIDNERRDFQTIVWPWFAASMHTYLPTIFIIAFDAVIIIKLVLLSLRPYQKRNFSPVQEQLTKVVLVISITFLVLSLPTILLNLITYLAPREFIHDPKNYIQILFASSVSQFLLFILCSINFPLYFLSLPMLRAEFIQIIKQVTRQASNETTDTCNGSDINTSEVNGKLLSKPTTSQDAECTLITQL